MRIFYIFILSFTLSAVYCQEPYHFILGNEQFSNIDIYGINQTDDGIYWIVSDKGLYSYNGYTFKQYAHPKQLSSSLFNLKKDSRGAVYCNNFNGQIFKVKNDTIKLFHTVPDSLLSPYITFDFLTDNSLIVYAKACYKTIDGTTRILLSKSLGNQGSIGASRDNKGRLLSYSIDGNTYRISKDTIEKIQVDVDKSISIDRFVRFIYHKQQVFASDNGRNIMLAKQIGNKVSLIAPPLLPSQIPSELYFTDRHFWFANRTHGVVMYPIPDNTNSLHDTKPSPVLFDEYFISSIFEDKSGNILLGTFDEGIIVIPKTEVANSLLPNLKIAKITLADNDNIYIGDENGNLYLYNNTKGENKRIFSNGEKTFDLLKSYPEERRLFAMVTQFITLDSNQHRIGSNNVGAVKDITKARKDLYFLATNYGLCRFNISGSNIFTEDNHQLGRSYSICYGDSNIFLGTSSGLFALTLNGEVVSELTFNSETILASNLEYSDAGLLISSQKHGLLRQSDSGLETFIDTENGLLSNSINQFQLKDEFIFIASEKGFQVFDLNGKLLRTLGASDGLNSTNLKDFAIGEQSIWLLHKYGLQRMPLNKLFEKEALSKLDKITVFNDNQIILPINYKSLAHHQNKIKLELIAPSLERQKDLTYSYFLEGIDEEWSEHQYEDNTVEYKSLPPGKYTFKVALKYKQNIQDTKEVVFIIYKAYWQTWWFYTLCGVFLLLVAYFFFKRRLDTLNQRALQINELNASKLTALQSQMNPHFIFNALNSIQDYIMLNERKLAGKYLGKFADLMRIYLNYSQLKNITLDEEIQALQLYLELEQLRFGDSLEFSISVQQELQVNTISFPSLLIQPYVENALKHGLFHKTGQKQLSIIFNASEDGQFLRCQVRDNGVGRKKAGEINKMRNPNHQSFATGATQRRLDLLNYGSKQPIGVEIEDLYKKNENAGTKVTMSIPLNPT